LPVRHSSPGISVERYVLKYVCIVVCGELCYTMINQDSLGRYCVQFRAEEPYH
jgi:hypothetical protein